MTIAWTFQKRACDPRDVFIAVFSSHQQNVGMSLSWMDDQFAVALSRQDHRHVHFRTSVTTIRCSRGQRHLLTTAHAKAAPDAMIASWIFPRSLRFFRGCFRTSSMSQSDILSSAAASASVPSEVCGCAAGSFGRKCGGKRRSFGGHKVGSGPGSSSDDSSLLLRGRTMCRDGACSRQCGLWLQGERTHHEVEETDHTRTPTQNQTMERCHVRVPVRGQVCTKELSPCQITMQNIALQNIPEEQPQGKKDTARRRLKLEQNHMQRCNHSTPNQLLFQMTTNPGTRPQKPFQEQDKKGQKWQWPISVY